ncbi:MFS transporter [Peribacillus simplex]|uniref:MFS transporter n=1 Tax=Peribacillus simplex TaxID=1478 RepID=UPI003673190F
MQNDLTDRKRKSIILSLLFIGMMLSYFDRLAINIGIIPMGKELNLDPSQTGLLLSAFYIGYTIMQPIGGWLTDKFGARVILTFSILSWSVFTVLTGIGWSLASLLVIRFLFGIGEGGFYPASYHSISETFSEKEYGRATSFFKSAAAIGSTLGTGLTAYLVVTFGWRGMFIGIGFVGIVVAWLFWVYLKPQEKKKKDFRNQVQQKVPLKKLFKIKNIWKIMIANFFLQIVQGGILSWMPSYLVKEKGLNLEAAGALLIIPGIVSFLMLNVSGWVLDKYLVRKEKYLVLSGFTLSVIFIYFVFNASTVSLGIIFLTLNSIALAFIGPAIFTMVLKYGPRELTGSATGFINLGGVMAGAISPAIIGFAIQLFEGSYYVVSYFLSISALMGVVSAFMIKNNQPSEENDAQGPKELTV